MSVIRCKWCGRHIQWLRTRRSYAPFEYDLVDLDDLGDRQGWVISQAVLNDQRRAFAAPIEHIGSGRAATARRVMIRHDCPERAAADG